MTMNVLKSSIQSVTVFPRMASVTREASATLTPGEQVLVFDQLPATIIESSIQVKGAGKAVMGNVKVEKVLYKEESNLSHTEL